MTNTLDKVQEVGSWLTPSEAAALAGVSNMSISKWVREKKFEARPSGGSYRINQESFNSYLDQRTRKKNPFTPTKKDWDEAEGKSRVCTVCERKWPLSKNFWHKHPSEYLEFFHTICKFCRNGNPLPGSNFSLPDEASESAVPGQAALAGVSTNNIVIQTIPLVQAEAGLLWDKLAQMPEVMEACVEPDRLEKINFLILINGNSEIARELLRRPENTNILSQKTRIVLDDLKIPAWWVYSGAVLVAETDSPVNAGGGPEAALVP